MRSPLRRKPRHPETVGDLIEIEKKLVRTIRANRSQGQINRKLKFTDFNGIAKIEQGRRRILWREFVLLCEACSIDLADVLGRIQLPIVDEEDRPLSDSAFTSMLAYGFPNSAFRPLKGWTSARLKRIRSGAAALKLIDVLALLLRNDLDFATFESSLRAAAAGKEEESDDESNPLDDPWVGILYALMEFERIQGTSTTTSNLECLMSEITGMPLEAAKSWFADLLKNGTIQTVQSHYKASIYQRRMLISPENARKLHERMGDHLVEDRKLPPEKRQRKASVFQFLAANAETQRLMEQEIQSFREKIAALSRAAVDSGKIDRLMLAETILLNPLKNKQNPI